MLRLKEDTYFASTPSGSFVLAGGGVLRLDESVDREVVDAVMTELARGTSFCDAFDQLPEEYKESANKLLSVLVYHGVMVLTGGDTSDAPHLVAEPVRGDCFVLRGPLELSAVVAAGLGQGGLSVVVEEADTAEVPLGGLACLWIERIVEQVGEPETQGAGAWRIVLTDEGVCWWFVEDSTDPRVHLHLAVKNPTSHSHDADRRFPDATLLRIAGTQIAHHMVGNVRGPARAYIVTFLDRCTLATSTHDVALQPSMVRPTGVALDLVGRQDAPPLSRREMRDRWARLSDERFGMFGGPDEGSFRQLPLNVSVARLADPCGRAPSVAVVGAGVDRTVAREQAILQAIATHGSGFVDPRLLVDRGGARLCDSGGDVPSTLRSIRAGSVDAFVLATDLFDGREVLVPAHRVFPTLRGCPMVETPCGSSADLDWNSALTKGLLEQCVRLTVEGSTFQGSESRALSIEELDADPRIGFLADMVRAARIDLTLVDITGSLEVPVVAARSTSGPTAYGGGGRLVDAVQHAIMGALFHDQVRRDAALSAALTVPRSAFWVDPEASVSVGTAALIGSLRRQGYKPSVVALDHAPAIHALFPYVLRVIV